MFGDLLFSTTKKSCSGGGRKTRRAGSFCSKRLVWLLR